MRFLCVLIVGLSLAAPAMAQTPDRAITVTARAEVQAEPDLATLTLGVEATAKTAAAAMAQASDSTAAVLDYLAEAGVEKADMQTSQLSLNPIWSNYSASNPTRRIDGFAASNMVTVRVRDLDSLGRVLDQVIQKGANSFRGLSFGLQNPDPLMDQARIEAVQEARRKAELYAQAAGVTLGPLVSLSEAGNVVPQPMMMMEAARMSADVPIAMGEVGISAGVTLVFEITP